MSAELYELLTVDEVAAILKVSKSWVYEHTRSRGTPRGERLPYVKVGKYVRFDVRLVREFIARRTSPVALICRRYGQCGRNGC